MGFGMRSPPDTALPFFLFASCWFGILIGNLLCTSGAFFPTPPVSVRKSSFQVFPVRFTKLFCSMVFDLFRWFFPHNSVFHSSDSSQIPGNLTTFERQYFARYLPCPPPPYNLILLVTPITFRMQDCLLLCVVLSFEVFYSNLLLSFFFSMLTSWEFFDGCPFWLGLEISVYSFWEFPTEKPLLPDLTPSPNPFLVLFFGELHRVRF